MADIVDLSRGISAACFGVTCVIGDLVEEAVTILAWEHKEQDAIC